MNDNFNNDGEYESFSISDSDSSEKLKKKSKSSKSPKQQQESLSNSNVEPHRFSLSKQYDDKLNNQKNEAIEEAGAGVKLKNTATIHKSIARLKNHSDFQFERQTFMVPDRAPTMSFNVVKDSDFYVDPLRHSRSKRRRQSRDSVFSRHSRRRAMSPRRRNSPTDVNDASQRAKMLFQTSKSRRSRRRPRTQPDRELHERRPSASSSSQASTPGEMPLATVPVIKPSTSQRVTNRFQRYWSHVDGVMFEFECGLEERVAKNRWLKPLQFVDWNLRGVSQVMFVNNPLSGLIIAVAMLIAAPVTGSLALVACVVANGAALLANLSRSSLKSGLFGYNAVLVGCALALCTVDVEYQFVLAVVGALLSVLFSLTVGSLTITTFNVAPLTVPFNISILLLLAALTTRDVYFGSHPDSVVVTPLDDQVPLSALFFVKALFRGVSQVYVYDNMYVGIAMLAGMFVSSRIMAALALLGSAVGMATAFCIGAQRHHIEQGLWGFNACLALLAVQFFFVITKKSFVLGVVSAVVATMIQASIFSPSFTFPFCVGAIAVLILQGSVPGLVVVRLEELTTPEQHLRTYKILRAIANNTN